MIRKLCCAIARRLLATEYGLQDDVSRLALFNANSKIQRLKRENSRLSIQNTVLKTKAWVSL